jgi:hypothetical protein
MGISKSLLSPDPKEGTLLFNLTYFASRIAHREDSSMLRKLEKLQPHVADEILNYDFDSQAIRRIVESLTLKLPRRRTVQLVTDLVPFKPTRRNQYLLVYSTKVGNRSAQLSTTFVAQQSHVDSLVPTEDDSPLILPRYNSAIDGFTP